MESPRFYQTRADLALQLSDSAPNSSLRDKYLSLWRSWSKLALEATARKAALAACAV